MAGLIAVVAVAAVVAGIMISTRKNHLELSGEVLKVRSRQLDPEHTIALIDVRVHNPSTQQFLVKDVDVFVDDASGKALPAELFTEIDIQRVVEYYPDLGKKYTQGLIVRDKINPNTTADRTVSISAPMTDAMFNSRKNIRIRVHDADGTTAEFSEKPTGDKSSGQK